MRSEIVSSRVSLASRPFSVGLGHMLDFEEILYMNIFELCLRYHKA